MGGNKSKHHHHHNNNPCSDLKHTTKCPHLCSLILWTDPRQVPNTRWYVFMYLSFPVIVLSCIHVPLLFTGLVSCCSHKPYLNYNQLMLIIFSFFIYLLLCVVIILIQMYRGTERIEKCRVGEQQPHHWY